MENEPGLAEPGRTFLILGGLTALVLCFATPPFQVPDEAAHFFRAYALSEGVLSGTRVEGRPGYVLPVSVPTTKREWEQDVPFHSNARVDLDRGLATLGIPLEPERRRFKPVSNAIVAIAYSPVPYVPQAIGIALGRAFGAPAIVLFYLGRLANAGVAIAICWLAIVLAPFGKWPLTLLLLTPIACFLRSSLSADSVTFALVFANLSAGLAIASSETRPGPRLIRTYAVTTTLVLLCKYAYFWIPMAIGIGLVRGMRLRDGLRWAGLPVLAGLFGVGAWALYVRDVATPIAPGSDPWAQLSVIVAAPVSHLALLADHLALSWRDFYAGLVGTLGWIDAPLPGWFVHLYWLLLGILTLAHGAPRPDRGGRLALFAIGVLGYLTVVNTLFLTMPMAAQGMRGMQARYLIPVSPFLLLSALGALPGALPRRWIPGACWALGLVSLGVTTHTLVMRYYGPA